MNWPDIRKDKHIMENYTKQWKIETILKSMSLTRDGLTDSEYEYASVPWSERDPEDREIFFEAMEQCPGSTESVIDGLGAEIEDIAAAAAVLEEIRQAMGVHDFELVSVAELLELLRREERKRMADLQQPDPTFTPDEVRELMM